MAATAKRHVHYAKPAYLQVAVRRLLQSGVAAACSQLHWCMSVQGCLQSCLWQHRRHRPQLVQHQHQRLRPAWLAEQLCNVVAAAKRRVQHAEPPVLQLAVWRSAEWQGSFVQLRWCISVYARDACRAAAAGGPLSQPPSQQYRVLVQLGGTLVLQNMPWRASSTECSCAGVADAQVLQRCYDCCQ